MSLTTCLAILQQSEYHWPHFVDWLENHPATEDEIEPQVWTPKLKLIRILSQILFFLPLKTRLKSALVTVKLIEKPIKFLIVQLARIKLARLQKKGLRIVAIAGSYAKTSTKHCLAHILENELKLVISPKSVNTPLGISQVIRQHLRPDHQLLVVELGEYYPGDIAQLVELTQPDYGILTPIGHQHLERMGSIETIAQTMNELVSAFENRPSHLLLATENRPFFGDQYSYYGHQKNDDYQVSLLEISRRGTEFKLKTPELSRQQIFSPLFGLHQAANCLPAMWLSEQLELNTQQLFSRISTLPHISRRLEPTFAHNNVLILDNSYNTNPDSITKSLQVVKQIEASKKIIITMGFIELGQESDRHHHKLGQLLAQNADYVGLVKSRWNQEVEAGFLSEGGKKDNFIIAANPDQALELLRDKIEPESIILIEGGYQEIFT